MLTAGGRDEGRSLPPFGKCSAGPTTSRIVGLLSVGSVPLSWGFPTIFGPFSPGPGSGLPFPASSSFSAAGPWHTALGRKLDRKCQRLCSIASAASVPGRESPPGSQPPAAEGAEHPAEHPGDGKGHGTSGRFEPVALQAPIPQGPAPADASCLWKLLLARSCLACQAAHCTRASQIWWQQTKRKELRRGEAKTPSFARKSRDAALGRRAAPGAGQRMGLRSCG